MVMAPAVGASRPEMTRSSVVLPAPLAPITPTASPASTRIDTPNSAWKPAYPASMPFSSSTLPPPHATASAPRYTSTTRRSDWAAFGAPSKIFSP